MDIDRTVTTSTLAERRDAARETFVQPPPARKPVGPDASVPALTETTEATTGGGFSLRRLIGDIDIRHLSPRQMADASMDLYVAGVLPWEEYAMLAFQAELHPDYDRTIGALTGQAADPDRPRDFLADWEERLAFDVKYNADNPQRIERTRHIVNLFRQIDSPTNVMI